MEEGERSTSPQESCPGIVMTLVQPANLNPAELPTSNPSTKELLRYPRSGMPQTGVFGETLSKCHPVCVNCPGPEYLSSASADTATDPQRGQFSLSLGTCWQPAFPWAGRAAHPTNEAAVYASWLGQMPHAPGYHCSQGHQNWPTLCGCFHNPTSPRAVIPALQQLCLYTIPSTLSTHLFFFWTC